MSAPTPTDTHAPDTTLPEESTRFRWLGLAAICLGVMTVFFNITATFTVLDPLQKALHVSSSELVWVTSAYSLVIGSLVLTAGTVGDLLGRKTVFLSGCSSSSERIC